jgi:hypothetical protein
MQPMKKKIWFFAVVFGSMFVLVSCKEDPNSLKQNSNPGKGVRSVSARAAAGLDTTVVDAQLNFSVIERNTSTVTTDFSVETSAFFTDDTVPVNVTYAKVNSRSLVATSITGEYLYADSNAYGGTHASWDISGYSGGTLMDNATVPSLITLTSLNPADSVSKLSGFTINYSGYEGGDLDLYVRFDRALTQYFIDSTIGANGDGYFIDNVDDDGSVTISSSDLSSFTSGGYIEVMLHHWEYHVVFTSLGRPVGVYSEVTKTIPLFLKP